MMPARTAPVYDPKRDGNPFAWIYSTAQAVRAERQAGLHARFVLEQLTRRADLAPAAQR